MNRQQRVHALAMWITTRARVVLIMRRALAHELEALSPDAASADDEPRIRNALTHAATDARR
jgi:hypothetical protein